MTIRGIDVCGNLGERCFVGTPHALQIDLLKPVIERARKTCAAIISPAQNYDNFLINLDVCNAYPGYVYTAIGCHPTYAHTFSNYVADKFIRFSQNKYVVAVGEFGLDYDRLEFCEREAQHLAYNLHFDLAERTSLPLLLHDRNCHADFVSVIKKNRDRIKNGVVHSFTGTVEEAKELLDLGMYIGVNGCSLRTHELLAVVQSLPLERLLVETDAPYCAVKPTSEAYKHVKTKFKYQKKASDDTLFSGRNEPITLIQIMEIVSSLKEVSVEEIARTTVKNTLKLFPKIKLQS